MSKCVNESFLLGHAGKDPQVHILPSGTLVNLSLATSERFKDSRGRMARTHRMAQPRWLPADRRDPPGLRQEGLADLTSRAPSAPAPGRIGSRGSEVSLGSGRA